MYTHIPDSRDILFLREGMGKGISIDVGANVGLVTLLLPIKFSMHCYSSRIQSRHSGSGKILL
jgi:hypothetical protein